MFGATPLLYQRFLHDTAVTSLRARFFSLNDRLSAERYFVVVVKRELNAQLMTLLFLRDPL